MPRGKKQPPRELLKTPTGKRYIRRSPGGQFTKDQVDVGRSLSKDVRQSAKQKVKPGYGDQGDQRRRK